MVLNRLLQRPILYNFLLNLQTSNRTFIFLFKPFFNNLSLETVPIHGDNRLMHQLTTYGTEIFMRGILLIDMVRKLRCFYLFNHFDFPIDRDIFRRGPLINIYKFDFKQEIIYNIANSIKHNLMHSQQSPPKDEQTQSTCSSVAITFIIGDNKFQYSLPLSWTICKVKCLLVSQNSQLNFDNFELMYCGHRLKGDSIVESIVTDVKNEATFIVINMKSQITFLDYYTSTMCQYMQKKHQPVMHPTYQKTISFIQNQPKVLQQNININQPQEFDNLFQGIFQFLRYIGWGYFFFFVLSRGRYFQILFILCIVSWHYFIGIVQRKRKINGQVNINNNQNNQNNENTVKKQPVPPRPQEPLYPPSFMNTVKAQLLIRYYKLSQIICCFVLTLFPNFDLHLYHHMMENRVRQWRDDVEILRPGTYKGEWVVK